MSPRSRVTSTEYPEAIPLDEPEAEAGLHVLAREFPTASGPIDALATDRRANACLIETKLFENPDKRLVVAQIQDYAAALCEASLSADAVLSALRADAERRGVAPPLQRLGEFLNQGQDEAREHVESLCSALAAGQFTGIVLMDRIVWRLKTLISFLNERSDFRILAVELD